MRASGRQEAGPGGGYGGQGGTRLGGQAASEGNEGAIARAQPYVEAGAGAILLEAPTSVETFRQVRAALPGVKLLADRTDPVAPS